MKRIICLLVACALLLPLIAAVIFAGSSDSGVSVDAVVWGKNVSEIAVTCPASSENRLVWATLYSGGQMYGTCQLSTKNAQTYSGTLSHLPLSDYRIVTLKIFQLDAETLAPLCDTYSETFTVRFDEVPSSASALNVGYVEFSGGFSPFFSATAYDQDVSSMTQVGLLTSDRTGSIVLNGIDGETRKHNGTDYAYYGIADLDVTENTDGTVYYDFTLRDDVKFADGHVMDIDDVIFSMYVLCDPTYDGTSTLYKQPILGLDAYRAGMESRQNLILATERNGYTTTTHFTEEQYNAFWAAFDRAGDKFCQEIVDYCAFYGATSVSEAGALWGYPDLPENATTADLFKMMVDRFGYDLSYDGINYESAGTSISTFIARELGGRIDEFSCGVQTGVSAKNIEGIQKTGDNSLRVTMTQLDATSIYQLGFSVAPMHYYGEASKYDYDNNLFGFVKGDLSHVRSVTAHPMGAGPYQFVKYEDDTVSFKANEYYYQGVPKTQYINFIVGGDEENLENLISGSLDATAISFGDYAVELIQNANSNGTLNGDVAMTLTTDNLGYGYMGICADTVLVGSDPGSEASKNLRKAFATVLSVYRDLAITNYYGETASIINYPISNTSWAAPQPNDEGYELAFSRDVNGDPIYTAGMTKDEMYAAALDAALGYFEAAGYTVRDGMLNAAPEGASLEYEFLLPGDGVGNHPFVETCVQASNALKSIGMNLIVTDLSNSSDLWTGLDAVDVDMWAAAWGSTVDPDMFQIYHSSNRVGLPGATGSNHYRINDPELDALIMDARSTTDQAYRKGIYKQCLDIILDWAVEVPGYQRQNAVVVSSQRVDMSTVAPDVTPFYGWLAEVHNIELGATELPETPSQYGPDGRERSEDQTYRTLYSAEAATLNYLRSSDAETLSLAANFIDPLVEHDAYGNIAPCGAVDWTVEDETYTDDNGDEQLGQKWTFTLRPDQNWYDCNGDLMGNVTALDYVAAMDYVCDPDNECANLDLTQEYVRYCEAEDDDTLIYHLSSPRPYFLTTLCNAGFWPAPASLLEDLGSDFGSNHTQLWYNGAYLLDTFSYQDEHILVKNESNWDADDIHITLIEETYNADAAAAAPSLFLNREIDGISISKYDLSAWQEDIATEALVTPARVTSDYTYFYGFNFEPRFDEQYEPENWSIAVNTENFRQAIKAGFDRQMLYQVAYPDNYSWLMNNTITPANYCIMDGTDYIHYGDLRMISARDSFDEDAAVEYMKNAIPEILASGGHFPVIVLVQHNGSAEWSQRSALIKEHMESLFNTAELKALTGGNDVVQFEINNYGTAGFLSGTRRAGNYCLQELNWGCDYADPYSFLEPFTDGNNYTFAYDTSDQYGVNTKTDETLAIHEEFMCLLEEANAETIDMGTRYSTFARAEAYYIDHAMVIPYGISASAYQATYLNPFEGQYAAYGSANYRYKGMWVYESAMIEPMYENQLEAWLDAIS